MPALVHEAGKAVLIAVNKWDLVEKETNTMRDMEVQVRQDLSFMPYARWYFSLRLQDSGWTSSTR